MQATRRRLHTTCKDSLSLSLVCPCPRSCAQIYASLRKARHREAALKMGWSVPFCERKIREARETRATPACLPGPQFQFSIAVVSELSRSSILKKSAASRFVRFYYRFPRRRLAFSRRTTTTTAGRTMTRLKFLIADVVYAAAYQVIFLQRHFQFRIPPSSRIFILRTWIFSETWNLFFFFTGISLQYTLYLICTWYLLRWKSRVYFKEIFIISWMHEKTRRATCSKEEDFVRILT